MTLLRLDLRYGTSRGRDTDGYPTVALVDRDTGRRFRTMGGGYDLHGTVLGDWLADRFQTELRRIDPTVAEGLYGLRLRADGTVAIDGACGVRSVERIAEAIGLRVRDVRDGSRPGWIVEGAA